MPVSHAPVPSRALDATAGQERVPGLLEVLAQVADPRKRRGRRFSLVFTLAVALVCVLAGASSFREIGDQAASLPQGMLAGLGGVPCPLRRRIPVPSEKRIRTLLQDLDGDAFDVVIGGWLRRLAAGQPGGLAEHVAIDGKWLRGVGDGQVKLFAALQHGDGVIIAQHRIPRRHHRDDPGQGPAGPRRPHRGGLTGAVVTADAAHASRETAAYIAGERGADYLLTVKGDTPGLQRAIYDKIQSECVAAAPDHADTDRSHGRTVRRSLWPPPQARAPASRTPPRSSASAATPMTLTARPSPNRSCTPPSACSASPGSPRSPAPSRHSAATAPESSTSSRFPAPTESSLGPARTNG